MMRADLIETEMVLSDGRRRPEYTGRFRMLWFVLRGAGIRILVATEKVSAA